jgi:hypothetical protein
MDIDPGAVAYIPPPVRGASAGALVVPAGRGLAGYGYLVDDPPGL